MNNLNAMFRPPSVNPPVRQNQEHPKSVVNTVTPKQKTESSPKTERTARKERSDKKKDIKFPVNLEQREELRRRAKQMKIENRDPKKRYETISNTQILLKALEQQSIFPERYPPLIYTDTKQYMHVEPTLRDMERIEELAFKWNLSVRAATFRLMMNYLFLGEVDSDAYRSDQ